MVTTTIATVWSGDDLGDFLEDNRLSPEQVADGLRRQALTIRNWIKQGNEPFAGNEDDSIVLRLAIIGLVLELKGGKLAPPSKGPPLKITLYIDPNDSVEGEAMRMIRQRRAKGSLPGDRTPIEFGS